MHSLYIYTCPQHGETALHIASKYSQPEVISAFAESGANMNVIMEVSVVDMAATCYWLVKRVVNEVWICVHQPVLYINYADW